MTTYLIKADPKTASISVAKFEVENDAIAAFNGAEGKYRYLLSNLEEMKKSNIPPLVLKNLYTHLGGGELKSPSKEIEKIWKVMSGENAPLDEAVVPTATTLDAAKADKAAAKEAAKAEKAAAKLVKDEARAAAKAEKEANKTPRVSKVIKVTRDSGSRNAYHPTFLIERTDKPVPDFRGKRGDVLKGIPQSGWTVADFKTYATTKFDKVGVDFLRFYHEQGFVNIVHPTPVVGTDAPAPVPADSIVSAEEGSIDAVTAKVE